MKPTMMEVAGKQVAVFAEHVDGKAWNQLCEAMHHPAAVKAAVMPDVHAGYALPIGSVVAAKDAIFPAWVGYDIGCGMCAAPLSESAAVVRENDKAIFDAIYKFVPVGFSHNEKPATYRPAPYLSPSGEVAGASIEDCRRQVGTLGGGNHFIELAVDANDRLWVVVHSGSRNIGHKIASHYMRLASKSNKAKEGSYALEIGTQEAANYIRDMNFALDFALANRRLILERVMMAIESVVGRSCVMDEYDFINRNHNHAEFQSSSGLWIHRKGATHAESGMRGVIPGNMRDGSFVVTGLGNADSLCSSSHGAGRVLGRAAAKEALDLAAFKADMSDNGIVARVDERTLDESPLAYKDIFKVMEAQSELVRVDHHLRPIINIKG